MRMMRPIVALLLMIGWIAGQAATRLDTAPVTLQTVAQEETFDAVVEAVNKSTVSAQATGRVTEVNFDVDDYVKQGSVLLRIRNTDQRAAVRAAEARLAEAKAEFSRMKELYAKSLVSRSMYDRAEANYKSTAADAAQAREGLGHTVVRAPYSGVVVERHIEVGETANVGQPLMTGISLESLRVTASVPQIYINTVRRLARARVILPSGESVGGGTLTISPLADPLSHTFKVRVVLPNEVEGLYPGEFAKVAFTTGEEKRLVVPARAVAYRSEVTAVYVVKADGKISFRQVRLGDPYGENIEVLAGLGEGEKIALDPIKAGIALKEQRAGSGS